MSTMAIPSWMRTACRSLQTLDAHPSFRGNDEGTKMTDDIIYQIPFGIFGAIAHVLYS